MFRTIDGGVYNIRVLYGYHNKYFVVTVGKVAGFG